VESNRRIVGSPSLVNLSPLAGGTYVVRLLSKEFCITKYIYINYKRYSKTMNKSLLLPLLFGSACSVIAAEKQASKIDVHMLVPGVYFIMLESGNKKYYSKFIKI